MGTPAEGFRRLESSLEDQTMCPEDSRIAEVWKFLCVSSAAPPRHLEGVSFCPETGQRPEERLPPPLLWKYI